jgi:diguanylate cyclase (GGDEF)-like protein
MTTTRSSGVTVERTFLNMSMKRESSLCPAAKTLKDGREREEELYLHHKKGHRVPVSIRVAPIHDPQGRVIGAVEVFGDNSTKVEAKQAIEELQRMALLDTLTQVGNRRFAEMNLTARLGEQNRYGWTFGVLFMDIDHFKDINDTYGHEVGDQILRMTAKTLSNSVRSFDLVTRWGGEEFLAIIANVDGDRLHIVAEKLRAMMERSSISHNSETIKATISIGATVAQPEDSVDSLVRRADKLMYESKLSGRNRVTLN